LRPYIHYPIHMSKHIIAPIADSSALIG